MSNLATRLLSNLNDCFFAINDGVDWFNLVANKDNVSLLSAIRKVIIDTDGVTKINSVDVFLDRTTRNMTVTYNINTQYTNNAEAVQEVLI